MKKYRHEPLRVALLTPAGRGALAVVGVTGAGALGTVGGLFSPHGRVPLVARHDGEIIVGRWGSPDRGEELVVVRRSANHVEVHCHGGLAASEAVIADLEATGAVRQPWPTWLTVDGMDTIEIESREALACVAGPKATRILCRQLAGSLQSAFDHIASLRRAGDAAAVRGAVHRLRRAMRVGLRLTRPWRVVVVGPANAGKSSLVNALAGFARSIVSAQPGTTRDILETRIVLGGWELDLVDTAGMRPEVDHRQASATERAGIDRAMAAAEGADLILNVRAPDTPAPLHSEALQNVKRIDVVSKSDLWQTDPTPAGAIRASAVSGEGIDTLAMAIGRVLVPEESEDPALLDGAVPFTQRHAQLLDDFA